MLKSKCVLAWHNGSVLSKRLCINPNKKVKEMLVVLCHESDFPECFHQQR